MDSPALSIEGLSHSYRARRALDNASFCVSRASFVALLGLNGAGKSTLLDLVAGISRIQVGRIRIFGHDIERRPVAALSSLGVVFQQRTLDLDLSVSQNLFYHASLHGIGRAEARARSAELLARTGLTTRAKDKVRSLSGGESRRVEIARSLLHGPRLLILDEPTSGLDIKARAEILEHVRWLVKTNDVSVLWATHLVDEVDDNDALILLHRGRILTQGAVAEVAGGEPVADMFARLTADADRQRDVA